MSDNWPGPGVETGIVVDGPWMNAAEVRIRTVTSHEESRDHHGINCQCLNPFVAGCRSGICTRPRCRVLRR